MPHRSGRKRLRKARREFPASPPKKREAGRPETARRSDSRRRPSGGCRPYYPLATRPARRDRSGGSSGRTALPARLCLPHAPAGAAPAARQAVPGRETRSGGDPRGPLRPQARSRSRTSRSPRAPPAGIPPLVALARGTRRPGTRRPEPPHPPGTRRARRAGTRARARGPLRRPEPRRPAWRAPGSRTPACGSTICDAPTATRSCAVSPDDRVRPAHAGRPRGSDQPGRSWFRRPSRRTAARAAEPGGRWSACPD